MPDLGQISNLIGAIVSISINTLLIFLFWARMKGMPEIEYILGFVVILHLFPLLYLLIKAVQLKRPTLYFLQVGLMMAFLILELLLDYIFKLNFRQNPMAALAYITLFYSGTGGMIGVASRAGKTWIWPSALSFLFMVTMSLYQRHITGQ